MAHRHPPLARAVVAMLFVFVLVITGALAAGAQPFAYIPNAGSNSVTVIDTATVTPAGPIPVDSTPWGVAVNPAKTRVYVGHQNVDGVVTVIDAETNSVITTVAVGDFPIGVAVNPAGTRVYVANDDGAGGSVSVIDTTTNTVTDTITGVGEVEGLAVTPDGAFVYLANCDDNIVTVIDTTTNTVSTTVPVGDYAQGVAVHPDGTYVYVTNFGGGDLSVIATATNTVVATVAVGGGPYGVAVTPDGVRVYVANDGDDTVSVLETAGHTVVHTVALTSGAGARGVSVTPDGTRVYVVNPYINTVSVIDATATPPVVIGVVSTFGSFPIAFGDFIGNGPAATHFALTTPAAATAGSPFTFTVTALDQFGNVATGYTGTVHFSSSDAGTGVALPADYSFVGADAGVKAFTDGATLVTAGNRTLTATDTVTASVTGTSDAILVGAATATKLVVVAPPAATAGIQFAFTVTARDAFDNVATGYGGTVHFTSTDGAPTLPVDAPLVSGAGSFDAILRTAGSQTLTANDGSLVGTSGAILVGAASATHLTVAGPPAAVAGGAFAFTVTARDAFENVATGYGGLVHFTSTDPQAALPGDATLTNGTGNFGATLRTAGGRTLTATDTLVASITGASGVIVVSAAAATHLQLGAPPVVDAKPPGAARPRVAGTAFAFTVTALDPFNNVDTSYAGIVHFTSTDPQATRPADSPLTSGVGLFNATLRTAGNQTITGTDTVNPAITGTSNVIVVPPAPATHFVVGVSDPVVSLVPFTVTVTAVDQFGNVATGYAGIVHFTSSDPGATLPPDSTLVHGVGTFSATFRTPGSQTLTATDTVNSTITGSATIATVVPIPTLGTWAFLLLALGLAASAARAMRTHPTSSRGPREPRQEMPGLRDRTLRR